MPEMAGPALFEQLAQARPGLKVVYMSAHPVSHLTELGLATPGKSALLKPFSAQSLLERVRDELGAK
jgi:DNA-binding NtrC family response regulator